MSDLTDAVTNILDKIDGYELAEAYYTGNVDEVFSSEVLRRVLGVHNAYRLNFASVPVDAVLNRLEIAAVTATDQDANNTLNRVWEDNDLILESNDIHKRALLYGDAYAVVWPTDDGIQVYYNNPKTTTVLYDVEYPRRKRLAAKLWLVDTNPDRFRLNLYYPDRIERWVSTGGRDIQRDERWVPYTADGDAVTENPFGQVPVFHFRTERPYGTPEHRYAYGPQDAINKLVVTQMTTVDYQGAPQRYALANQSVSNEITDFDENATDRENVGSLQNGPGELWYLKGIDEVGQFDAADPKAFLEPLREYVRAMATLTNTPVHYFDRVSYMPSGEALRVAESPLVKKVGNRQASFGSTWRELFRFALEVAGQTDDVQVKWKRHESTDQLAEWELANRKRAAGLPLPQVLREQGYDEELVQQWTQE